MTAAGGEFIIVGAAAQYLGYLQNRQDKEAIVYKPEELAELWAQLQASRAPLAASHRDLTDAWHAGPLSLFEAADRLVALQRGVPDWALACVDVTQRLLEEVAELGDKADVYEAQFQLATQSGQSLMRDPVRDITERLTYLTQRLQSHVPFMRLARAAFEDPEGAGSTGHAAAADQFLLHAAWAMPAPAEELPDRIFRERGQLGKVWRSQSRTFMKALKQVQSVSSTTFGTQEAQPAATSRSVTVSAFGPALGSRDEAQPPVTGRGIMAPALGPMRPL